MNKKIIIFIIVIVINLLVNTGCWNYSEIDDKIIVAGAAVDYDKENDKLILTIEAVKPIMKGMQTEIQAEILKMEGENFFDAARNFIAVTGKKIFWSHAKVIIMSEDIINNEELFLSVLDFLSRDAETRDDLWLFLYKGEKAMEVWDTDLKIQSITSFHLDDMMKNDKSYSKFKSIPLWEFIDNLAYEGINATLPTVDVVDYQGKVICRTYGTAVFKGPKKIGWLNGSDSKTFLMVIDKLKGGTLVVNEKVESEIVPIALEIFNNKTKIKPVQSGETITMKIETETTANINDVGTEEDFIAEEGMNKLKKDGEKLIEKSILDLIKKVQMEYKSDIFGFGGIIEREMPSLWKEISSNWDEVFPNLKIDVKSELIIRGSALRSKTIKTGE